MFCNVGNFDLIYHRKKKVSSIGILLVTYVAQRNHYNIYVINFFNFFNYQQQFYISKYTYFTRRVTFTFRGCSTYYYYVVL